MYNETNLKWFECVKMMNNGFYYNEEGKIRIDIRNK